MQALKRYYIDASLSQKIYPAEQVRMNEVLAAKECQLSMYQLMQRAGRVAFEYAQQNWPHSKHWLILAGKGNNAGDGYVVATMAQQAGLHIRVSALDPDDVLTGDACLARQQWLDSGGSIQSLKQQDFTDADLLIDALFGTGLNRPLSSELQTLIGKVNDCALPTLSLDIPSGLNANTGQPMPAAIRASKTITFVSLKPGLITGRGREHCGKLTTHGLGINAAFEKYAQTSALLAEFSRLKPLPPRELYSHKGNHGRLLCIGGNLGMPGAIRMCAEAALRSGTGLVKVLCHPTNQQLVLQNRPELMLANPEKLSEELTWADSIVLGPGLGQDKWARDCYQTVLKQLKGTNKPLLIDADGLRLLSEHSPQLTPNCVLTPHPGEAAALLQFSNKQVEQDRYKAITALQHKYQCAVLLKGSGTLIHDQQQLWVCADGNPGMASAGMGDVLSGIIGALMAQGMPTQQAVVYGTCLHSKAADLSAQQNGQRGMLASDLYAFLPQLIN